MKDDVLDSLLLGFLAFALPAQITASNSVGLVIDAMTSTERLVEFDPTTGATVPIGPGLPDCYGLTIGLGELDSNNGVFYFVRSNLSDSSTWFLTGLDTTSGAIVSNFPMSSGVTGLPGGVFLNFFKFSGNQAPIADAGPDQRVSTGDNDRVRVTLDGSASSDPDGDPLTFTWTGLFGTLAGVVVNPVLKPGTHNITLTVEDGKGGVASDRMTVVVTDGRPPKLTVSPRELSFSLEQDAEPASQPFTLRVERGPVNYTIRRGGSWLRANPDRGRVSDGEEHRILVVVDPRPAVGTHTAPLFIRSSQVSTRVLVTLVITPGSGVLPPEQPEPAVSEHAVVNAASLIPFGSPGHPVALGSMVSIFGSNFTDGEHFEAENIPLPFTLGGVSVTFNGLPAALYGVWPDQINAQLSWGLAGSALQPLNAQPGSQQVTSTATLVVQNANGSSDPSVVEINTFSPAIFTTSATGAGQGTVFFAKGVSTCLDQPQDVVFRDGRGVRTASYWRR